MKRRYSSVGPAVSHRRLLVKDFDCIKVVAEEVLQLAGAPDKKREHWILFEMKVDEMNRTGTPEEMGVQYEGGDLHESEIKQTTIQVKRRYTELQQLVKYLKKTLPKQNIIGGKKAMHANTPAVPAQVIDKTDQSLLKSEIEWPGTMSKSAMPQAGTPNAKYLKCIIQHPTEKELKFWFVSLCGTKGAQDTEGFQHFLKSDDARVAEFGDSGGCCSIS